jgi:hypothetical protein
MIHIVVHFLFYWLVLFGIFAIPGWIVGHFIPRSMFICLIVTEAFTLFWTVVLGLVWLVTGASLAMVMGNTSMLKMGLGFLVFAGQIIFLVPIFLSILLGLFIFRRPEKMEPQKFSISPDHSAPKET